MAHSPADAASFVIPLPPSRLVSLHPLALRALEELLLFYAGRKASHDELAGSLRIGILELVHVWLLHGNAVDILDTYEKYLAAVGELVAVYDGTLDDLLVFDEPAPRSAFIEMLLGHRPPRPTPTLHPAVRRETYEHAARRRQTGSAPN